MVCDRDIERTWDWNKTFLEEAFNLKILKGLKYSHRHVRKLSRYSVGVEEITGFDWDFVRFKERTLLLRLNFSDPLLISVGLDFDTLEVQTNATLVNNLFRAKNAKFEEDQILDRYIPVQLKNETSEVFDKAIPVVSVVQAAIMTIHAILNIFLVGTATFYWVLINYLQMIVHLPMFSVNFPANARWYLKSISTAATFKFVEPTQLFDWIDAIFFQR